MYRNLNLSKMNIKNHIGLDQIDCRNISEKLNQLLSNYQVLYINVRGFHWNIKGSNFFELHAKFEEIYNDLQIKIDEIAERILTLGFTPLHSYSDYLKTSSIAETKDIQNGKEGLEAIVKAMETNMVLQRKILEIANDANDEGTNALMSDYIREQEKMIWMYSSYLNK